MTRYHLVSYFFRQHGNSTLMPNYDVTTLSAAEWVEDTHLKHNDGDYLLVSHIEITKDEYERLEGRVG